MIIQQFDNSNTTIQISNFQLKCLLETIRPARMIEMYHAAEKMHKAGFTKCDSSMVNSEVQNFITTVGRLMDNYISLKDNNDESGDTEPERPVQETIQ